MDKVTEDEIYQKGLLFFNRLKGLVKQYADRYPPDPKDKEQAREMVKCGARGLRPLLKFGKTIADLRRVVDERYGSAVSKLCELAKKPPSVERLEKTCAVLVSVFETSVSYQDISCLFSSCLSKTYGILSERPSVRKNNAFSKEEQDRIAQAVQKVFRVYVDFFDAYLAGDSVINDLQMPNAIARVREIAETDKRVRAMLFRKSSSGETVYDPEMFELLQQESELQSKLLDCGMPETVQAQIDYFDEYYEVASAALRMPIIRKYLLTDPKRYAQESVMKLRQIEYLMTKADEDRVNWPFFCEAERFWKDKLHDAKTDGEFCDCHRKLKETRQEKSNVENRLRDLGLTIEDLMNQAPCAADSSTAKKVKPACKKRKRSPYWDSDFVGLCVKGVIEVLDWPGAGCVLKINGDKFLLKSGKAGEIIDELLSKLDAQKSVTLKHNDALTRSLTSAERNHFKNMRCLTDDTKGHNWFFKNIMYETIGSDHGKQVRKIEFNPALFKKS